jgi:hypothetical protein
MANLFIDSFGAGDGLADFFADEFLVALAEAEGGDADRAFGEALTLGDFAVAFGPARSPVTWGPRSS